MLEFGLQPRAALQNIVLRTEALLEFFGSPLEYRGAVADGREKWAGELSTFLIISGVLENVVDLPVDTTKGFVKDKLDSVLKEAEGDVNEQVESELGSWKSHFRGVGDVMERLEKVHEDSGFLGDNLMEDFRSDIGVEEDSYYSVDLNSESRGQS